MTGPSQRSGGISSADRDLETELHSEPNSDAGSSTAAPETRYETGRSEHCAILGPSGCGKTTLLQAMARACAMPVHAADPELFFVPESKAAAELIEQGINGIVNPAFTRKATSNYSSFPFVVEVHDLGKKPVPVQRLNLSLHDGPGGAIFIPEAQEQSLAGSTVPWRQEMLAHAKSASFLVLCVDAAHPQPVLWSTHLPLLLAEITEKAAGTQQRKLAAERVLLLLTRIDQPCQKAIEASNRDPASRLESWQRSDLGSAAHLAETLSPIEFARSLLGLDILNQIRAALKESCSFAVAAVSAGGFLENGEPFWDSHGRPQVIPGETQEQILRAWTPFGLRDAILFLASGIIQGQVQAVERRFLTVDPKRKAVRIFSSSAYSEWGNDVDSK